MHQPGVGGIMPRENNSRSMVSGEEEIPHKCGRTKGSQIDNNDFYYNKEELNFQPGQNGQHVSLVLTNNFLS